MKGGSGRNPAIRLLVTDSNRFEASAAAACPHLLIAFDHSLRRVLFANDAAQRVLGFTDEWRNSFLDRSVHPDDRRALENLSKYIDAQEFSYSSDLEVRLRDGMGAYRWYAATLCMDKKHLVDGEGTIYGTFSDLTKLKAVEAQRRQQEIRLRRLGDTLPNGGIYQIAGQPDGSSSRMTFASAGLERLLGIPADEIMEDPDALYSVIHEDDRPGVDKAEKLARETMSTYEHEFRLRTPAGQERWVLCRSAPLLTDEGELVWDGIVVDITRIKNAEYALLEAKEAVERESRLKDEFLAVLSHELRTPLHAILGWTQLIRTGRLRGEDLDRGMDVIERSTRAQAELIDDLLDVSRIVSEKLRLEMDNLRLMDVMKTSIAAVESTARDKKVQLDLHLDSLPERFVGDAGRLRQVFTNLLSNAVKFTPAGGTVSVLASTHRDRLKLTVKDTGIGISPEFLPYVFERFRQANATTTRKFGGLGLGLSIVKKLVELHGGTIEAASGGEGQGAEFTVTLPIRQEALGVGSADQVKPLDIRTLSLKNISVLVVDDELESQEIIRRMFETFGATVHCASSAQEALAKFSRVKPGLVVTDISMPDMDGYELLSRIRQSEGGLGEVPAIALTALARPDDKSKAERAGFHFHVPKPVDRQNLAECVSKIFADKS